MKKHKNQHRNSLRENYKDVPVILDEYHKIPDKKFQKLKSVYNKNEKKK